MGQFQEPIKFDGLVVSSEQSGGEPLRILPSFSSEELC